MEEFPFAINLFRVIYGVNKVEAEGLGTVDQGPPPHFAHAKRLPKG